MLAVDVGTEEVIGVLSRLLLDVLIDIALPRVDVLYDMYVNFLIVGIVTLEFAVLVSYSVDALCDAMVDMLSGILSAVIIGILPVMSVDLLAGVKAKVFEVVMTALEFAMP